MPDWYTDAAVLASFPSANGMTADQLAQAADDAQVLYAQVASEPGASDADLRTWAAGQGITTDRVNAAMALLRDAGRLLPMPTVTSDGTVESAPPPGSRPVGPPTVPASALTVAELRKAAKRLGVEVPASATKDEVAATISSSVFGE